MVATRRGTRIDPSEERGGEKHGGQPTMDSSTPASQVKTRSRVKRESQSEDAGGNDVGVESTPSESLMVGAQVVTRRRHKSGQSEGDVSEADSTTSSHSTRASRSRSVGVCLTESARKLRSHRSVLVTEPIPESKEDGDISEAESNCSSASSRVKKRQSASILSLITRSRRSVVAPESVINIKEDTDVSETESNCSSVSGIRSVRRTRNARTSIRKPLVEPLVDEISDAESCCSGISAQPIARRLNMRNKYKSLQDNMLSDEAKSEADQVEMPIQREMAYDAKVSEPLCSENSSSNAETKLPSQEIPNKASDEEDKEKSSHDKASVLSNDDSFESSTQINLKSKDPIDQSDFSANPESLMDVEQHPSESSDTSKEPTLILSTNSANCSTEIPEETNNDLDQDNPQSSSVVSKDELNELPRSNISLLLDSDDSDQTEESDSEDELEDEEGEINTALFVGNGKESRKSYQLSEELLGDGLFVIDTKPGIDSSEKYYMGSEEDDDAEDKMAEDAEPCKSGDNDDYDDFIDEDADEDDTLLNKPKMGFSLSTSIDTGLRMKDLGGLYISFDASKPNPGSTLLRKMKQGHKKADELLKKSVITPDFEKKDCVPLNRVHLKKLKKLRRQEREKTTGKGWFDMKAPELTEELKNDLKALKMRSAMDPKRFYKKNDRDGFPKYFQVGTVVDNPIDFYHSRIPKKERKRTIVEELLADAEFRRYNKRKYQEIIAEKAAQAEGKKNRKKKKFRN